MTSFAELQARLLNPPGHLRFAGAALELGELSPEQLGQLWPLLQAARNNPDTASPAYAQACELLRQAQQRQLAPRLDNAQLLATLRAAAPERTSVAWLLEQAGFLAGPPDAALAAALAPLLPPVSEWIRDRFALLAIARLLGAEEMGTMLADAVAQHFGDALPAREFAVLDKVAVPALATLAGSGYYDPREVDAGTRDPAAQLAWEPDYVAFARRALEEAAGLIGRIHAGAVAYQADGAFDPDDALVLGRAARLAAMRDEPWYPAVIASLLPGACVAPTAARTAPSQALTVALGHAVEGVPTPEAVIALREALQVVRHAGLQKKLARNLKPAERALAQRPEVALRLLDADVAPKQLRALLAQFLESALVRPFALPYAQWRTRFLSNDIAAGFARALVWRASASFTLGAGDLPVDAEGRLLSVDMDAPIALWHPVDAEESEREAWRAQIVRDRVRQPLRQVFRECYRPATADIFAGYQLATLRLLGVARREGWTLDGEALTRRFGELRGRFLLGDRIYPGLDAVVASGALAFMHGAGCLSFDKVPARVLSEACRAVDLLVSVAVVAADSGNEDFSLARSERLRRLAVQTGLDAIRRQAIAHVLRAQIADGRVRLEGVHVHVGAAQVSMRTGRVLRDGVAVEAEPLTGAKRLAALPWLPYDEVLLERVIHALAALLDEEQPG